jgi:hypothetical protein
MLGAGPALAEFEIKEAGTEKGEIELEYRGAVHWGFDHLEAGVADVELPLEEEAPLRQSHDFEFAWGITNRLLVSTTLVTEQPLHEDFNPTGVDFGWHCTRRASQYGFPAAWVTRLPRPEDRPREEFELAE